MLAALEAQTKQMGARRIVFDALDIVLALLPDAAAKRREVYRLHEWLLAHELTGIITAKADGDETSSLGEQPFGFMQFMVDCAVMLNNAVILGVSQRNLRVQKYRGSSFDENESPFLIGKGGFEIAVARPLGRGVLNVSKERKVIQRRRRSSIPCLAAATTAERACLLPDSRVPQRRP